MKCVKMHGDGNQIIQMVMIENERLLIVMKNLA